MALVTRDAAASIDASTAMYAMQVTGLIAGEDIDALATVYIKGTDGKLYMGNGTAANEAAKIIGVSPRSAKAGQPVTVFGIGTRCRYGSGLTPGATLHVAATKGRLDDAATTGDASGVARVIDATDILITRVG